MTGENEPELSEDIDTLLKECRVVVREDTTITLWNDEGIVLSMGTGLPIFYKTLGQEFEQTLLCLARPPIFYDKPDSFSVDEWVCIGRPGTYWGDVGLVRSLSDDDDEDRITILLVPRITDQENQAIYSEHHARPPLRKDLWPCPSGDLSVSTEGGEETWLFGRDRITKDGLLLRSFAPWELRKDMVDCSDLYLLPEQDTHFRRLLSPEHWPHMPPVRDPRQLFMRGERIQVNGHKGIVVGFDRSVGPDHDAFPFSTGKLFHAEIERIYSETWKGHVLCHSSFILKQHREYDTVFSLGLNENVTVVECDHFKRELTIRLRATMARKYKKEPLVSKCSMMLHGSDLPTGTSRAPERLAIPTLSR
jgi:hypothetical protein